MPLVHVKEDETFENALRRFKRKCEKSGILSELKKRQHYEKPSTKRKRKAIAARKKVLFAPTFSDVAQPIHKRALGRWHHYAGALEPYLPRLSEYCGRLGYPI